MKKISKIVTFFMVCVLATISLSNDAHALFRMRTLHNVVDAPINFSADNQPTLTVVEEILIAAFEEKGWTVKKVDSNKLIASILVRERHYAKVDVQFNTEKYSILYNDSDQLLYDGKKIHKNYNNWIKSVDKIIGFRVKNINFGTEY